MLLLNKHYKQKDHLLEMNLNKVDISHCINQDLIDDTVLCLLCKGIVIDPFKCSKCHQLYCKECLDYILSNDICNDGTTGCISYQKLSKIGIDDIKRETDVKCRSKNFVYPSKETTKKLTLLKFKCNFCIESTNQAYLKKKDQTYFYNIFIKHLSEHFAGNKREEFKEKKKRMTPQELDMAAEMQEIKEIASKTAADKSHNNSSSSKKEKQHKGQQKVKVQASVVNEQENVFLENGNCICCYQRIDFDDIKTHIALHCPELEQICLYCNRQIKRKDLHEHFLICSESHIECPDCEYLIKRGQNIQSHYCRRKDFDIYKCIEKFESIEKETSEHGDQLMKLMETKSDLNYLLSNIEDKLADKKDKFLMKFEKKILEDLQTLVKQNVKSIIEEQKCNVSDIQRCLISNNIIDEKSVKYPFDVIRNIYKFKSMEDDKSEGTKDRMFLTKNSCSVCVWSVELMKCIMNVQICDITQREKQTHVIDSCTILSSDILAIIIRNKIETKILAYKIPTMEDLKDLGTDYLEYSENECFGSFDIQGRVCMIKNSLLNSEYFYLIIEFNDKYVLQVMKLQEKANDKDKLEIIISLNKVSEKQLTSDIMDVCELSNGPFANHLVLLYGRNYEIYSIAQNEYKEGAFIKFTKIEGHYGILLPPHFLEYYHRVRTLDEEYLIFIGSSKIEIRKLTYEKNQTSYECSDDIYCTYSLSIEATVDKEELVQMEDPCYSSLYLFHNNRNSLREWTIDSEKKLSFRVQWENSSNCSFIYSIYLPETKQLILVDTNGIIRFITFADVKQEI